MNQQEKMWAGDFGDEYTDRNRGRIEQNIKFFIKAFGSLDDVDSVLEFGANVGENLQVIGELLGCQIISGVEINETACKELEKVADQVFYCSMLDFNSSDSWDLTFTKGVLIHIHPDNLPKAYANLYAYSNKYILIAEYFNPTPVMVEYRGKKDRLWKRDFCKDLMEIYPDLKLKDYGFIYHTDGQDDLNWFLLSK